MDNRVVYVYFVTNRLNGKRYVGKSYDPSNRWRGHVRKALNENSMLAFHCAIRKHGVDNFELNVHSEHVSEASAFEMETQLIREWNTTRMGYNMNEGGEGGVNPSDEVRKKISERRKGIKHTDEAKRKMSEALKLRQRKPHSEETKAKMRAARARMREEGRDKMTEEQRAKLCEAWARNPDRKPWNSGKKGLYSEEYKRKIGDGHRGKSLSDEHKAQISRRFKGTKLTPEHKEKIRRANTRSEVPQTPEVKEEHDAKQERR